MCLNLIIIINPKDRNRRGQTFLIPVRPFSDHPHEIYAFAFLLFTSFIPRTGTVITIYTIA